MARTSFTIRQTSLQTDPPVSGDDDSALKGDGYVDSPTSSISSKTSFLEARAIDYEEVKVSWGIGTLLSSTVGVTPVATQVQIRYDTVGEPQTVANGVLVATIDATRNEDVVYHSGLPSGAWVYYSVFVRYDSTSYRSWYEKVASVQVLMPARFGSRDMLWNRIPRHHRIQDGTDSSTISIDNELFGSGPLQRMMDVIGWDIDRLRTLIHHQMVTRDPYLATPEALDQLAYELGIPLFSQDLGSARVRDLVAGISYLRSYKGTSQGVREWITAITGSDVEIRPTSASVNLLTTQQSTFSSLSVNTNPAAVPVGNQWVVEPDSGGTATSSASGVTVVGGGASFGVAVLKTRVLDVKNNSWYRSYYDASNATNAYVLGFATGASITSASSVVVGSSGSLVSYPDNFVPSVSSGVDWKQAPVELGLIGDGTHTTSPYYLHIYVAVKSGSSITLNNVKVNSDDRHPYFIDVFSQRVNLCKDPQFVYGNTYWPRSSDVVPPFITQQAVLALDPKNSTAGENVMVNFGTGGTALNASYGSSTSAPLLLTHSGTNYLYVPPGGSGLNLVSIANQSAQSITGDLEMVVRFAADNWKYTSNQPFITKRGASPNQSWQWYLNQSDGIPKLLLSSNGTSTYTATAASVPTLVNGTAYWHKVTRNATTGVVSYYYASDSQTEPTSWTQISTGASTVAGDIWAGNASIDIAGNQQAGLSAGGKWYRAIVRSGIGASATAVVDIDFTTAITTGNELSLKFTGTAASAGTLTNAMYLSNLGTAKTALDMRTGNLQVSQTQTSPDQQEPTYISYSGVKHLYLPGTSAAGNSTVTAPSAGIPSSSLSTRAAIQPDRWIPYAPNTTNASPNAILSQYSSSSNQRSWLFWLSETGTLQMLLGSASTGGSVPSTHSGQAISASAGLLGVRADWDSSGNVSFYTRPITTAASSSVEIKSDTGWTQLGTTINNGVTALNANTQPLAIGTHSSGQNQFQGKFFSAYVRVDGTPVLDIDFASAISTGQETSFVESARGSTVTISRATSGRKPVCVTRPLWLFNSDTSADYMTSVRSDDSVNFTSSESGTVMFAIRQWATPVNTTSYLTKKDNGLSLNEGWGLVNNNATWNAQSTIDDGPTVLSTTATAPTSASVGGLVTNGFVLNRTATTPYVQTFSGTNTGSSSSIASFGDLSNTVPLAIGRYGFTGSIYGDFEFYGAAIWKRVLSSTEQTTIRNYFDGTETPEALALLAEAVFWIDPKYSSQRAAIVRSTTVAAMKSACVTRPVLLFDGSNDYLKVSDSPLLDITSTESMTALAVIRQQGPTAGFGRIINKRDFGASTLGWELSTGSAGSFIPYAAVDNGSGASVSTVGVQASKNRAALIEGTVIPVGFILDRSAGSLRLFSGSTLNSASVAAPVADFSTTQPLYIGGVINSVGTYGGAEPVELLGVYIWKRALTQAELNEAYRHAVSPGVVTTYSSSAGFGASITSAASVTFSTNPGIPVRQGVTYFFSIDDKYDNIDSVTLKSSSYGTLASAAGPYTEISFADGSKRKTWELIREYKEPWLPLNISDCYITLTGITASAGLIAFKNPILEPLNSSGEYFDGDSANGGWIEGATASAGVWDYRWGDAGADISFSYYTSDYQRTVSTLFRLLDTILPVTQNMNPSSLIKLDRIYGYGGSDRP